MADEQLASVVVPQVLAAPTIEKKNQALCSGVYEQSMAHSQKEGLGRRGRDINVSSKREHDSGRREIRLDSN